MTKEEFRMFLKGIGGLENGWRAAPQEYMEYNSRFLSKLNYYAFNILDYLGFPERKNPFRSKIKDVGFFSVGPGWYGLVANCILDCIDAGWNKQICQVKEKFGGLRFYINAAPPIVHEIISEYEELSYKTCEKCSSTKDVTSKGRWVTTLCKSCRYELEKENEGAPQE